MKETSYFRLVASFDVLDQYREELADILRSDSSIEPDLKAALKAMCNELNQGKKAFKTYTRPKTKYLEN